MLFRRSAAPVQETVHVGRSGEPVVIIDGGFADPTAIAAAAAARASFSREGITQGGYPGIQAPAPAAYVHALLTIADAALGVVFGAAGGTVGEVSCRFSLVTRDPATLDPLQTVPHVDVADPARFAVLHFLCDGSFGGTAFYRQAETGLEQVHRDDWPAYAAARDRAMTQSSGYPGTETPGYVQTAAIPVRMDRILVYRSHTLHSGIIRPGRAHSADPCTGRLTGNLFARYRTA